MAVHLTEFGVYVFVKSSPETPPALSVSQRNGAAIVNKQFVVHPYFCLWYKKNCSAVVCPGVMVNVQDGHGGRGREGPVFSVS